MSIWQFVAAMEGYAEAHDPEAQQGLSSQEADDLWNWLQTKH